MYVKRVLNPEIIFHFSWRPLLWTALLVCAVFVLYEFAGLKQVAIPFLPIATVGTAVAFYIGFKNNSSYDRLWESRKIWGEIVNVSRALAAYYLAVVRPQADKEEIKRFIYRQIAFVNILRLQLRRRNVWDANDRYVQIGRMCFGEINFEQEAEETLRALCTKDETEILMRKKNIAKELVKGQMDSLSRFKGQDWIDGFEHSDLMRYCAELYNQQGKAERIKNFPFPRQYAFFSEVFVVIFVCLLPFGLLTEFAKLGESLVWLTIPFSLLISWIFVTMEKVGDSSENPFENSLNDIPMTAICRNIEIDLREMLGEADLPPPIQAECDILM